MLLEDYNLEENVEGKLYFNLNKIYCTTFNSFYNADDNFPAAPSLLLTEGMINYSAKISNNNYYQILLYPNR